MTLEKPKEANKPIAKEIKMTKVIKENKEYSFNIKITKEIFDQMT